MKAMKILHTVEFYHPSVGGMQEVVRQISERLVKRGHEVTVATSALVLRREQVRNGVRIEEFAIRGNMVRGMTGEVERYTRFLLENEFDIVTNFAAQQWATDIALPLLKKIRGKKVFVPTGFSGLGSASYADYFERMKEWMRDYDMNVFLSDDHRDVNFARENGIERRMLIPNGAAQDEFLEEGLPDIRGILGIPRDHFLIVHVGSHTGVKGHAEAIKIFSRANIRHATFVLVADHRFRGCGPICPLKALVDPIKRTFEGKDKRIIVTPLGRPETVAAYREADLFLFPSNIECSPIVLFESLAGQTAFLSTDVGNAREIVKWSGGGEILPTSIDRKGYSHADIESSARMLEALHADVSRRNGLAQKGYAAWQERFTWEKIAGDYADMYAMISGK